MFLKAGALSLALLLASRLLGLARESALAASFGASGVADIVVLMLTLPDWLAGVLASGAFAYVLVPAWAALPADEVAASQRHLSRVVLTWACAFALLLALLRELAVRWLAGGVPPQLAGTAGLAVAWSALAFPAALLAALWTTRLQHERDFLGMYAANLVVNAVLVAAILMALRVRAPITWLGAGLLLAMLLRLVWLHWRTPRATRRAVVDPPLPQARLWWWAALSAGLPLALPFAARSIASHAGAGALATFNYAWKLVELPQILAIQLVGVLALPMIARAMKDEDEAATAQALRSSFALAWALACAAAAALVLAAPAVARLLFGWGRMDPRALAEVAEWGGIGAWSLLPQALLAVALNVLAARGRMGPAVAGYAVALLLLLGAGFASIRDGGLLMMLVDVLMCLVALAVLWPLRGRWRQWLPLRALLVPFACVLAAALAARYVPVSVKISMVSGLPLAVALAAAVIALAALSSVDLRRALAR